MIFSCENFESQAQNWPFLIEIEFFEIGSPFSIEFIKNYLDRSRILVSAESARIIPFPKIKNSSSFSF